MKALALLAVLLNAENGQQVRRIGRLEWNHYGTGCEQLIAWDDNGPEPWPIDWKTSPQGEVVHGMWFDANGLILVPDWWQETRTRHDPERAAYNSWYKRVGKADAQRGIWHP